jgi:hypothetical protein
VVLAIVTAVGVLGAAGCSSSGSDATAEVSQEDQAGLPSRYCEVYLDLPIDTPEAYVGSAEHVAELDRLIAAAPPSLTPALQTLRVHVASGAITSDPDTKLTENWPSEVRAAIEQVQDSSESGC